MNQIGSWALKQYRSLYNTEDSIEILGTVFSSSSSSNLHVNKRVQACRRAMYDLTPVGCCYPGLSTDVKAHFYKSIGLPSLLYGIEFTAHRANNIHDGIVDSLRQLVYHENFVKPYSEEHILATLLVKAFCNWTIYIAYS